VSAPPLIRSSGGRLDVSGTKGAVVTDYGSRHNGRMTDDAACIADERMEASNRVRPVLLREISGIRGGKPFTKFELTSRTQAFCRQYLNVVH
jgi:hypothetical protein